jgi:hypothetical protein
MRTLTYRCNPRIFDSRITLVWLFAFSVSLLSHPIQGQTQQPAGAEGSPAATPAATKPVAGQYEELPCKESRGKERTAIRALLKNPTSSAADLTTLQTYLQEYGLARWTVKAHEHEVRQFRRELHTNFRRIKSPQTYDQINDFVLGMLGEMASGNYSPVARINAMLAIGGLNVREPARSTEQAVPLAQALTLMLEAYRDPNQIDGVRLAALLGIFRHVSLGIVDAETRDSQVLPVMLELAKANQPPDGRSTEGHAWFRVRAMETLGALAVTGQQGEVANTLGDAAGDEKNPLWVRCTAARCLGQLNYADPTGMDPANFMAKLTQLAIAICSQEVATLEKLKRDELIAGHTGRGGGRMPAGVGVNTRNEGMSLMSGGREEETGGRKAGRTSGGPGMGLMMEDEEEDTMETRRIKGSRRRLKDRMVSVLKGLGTDEKREGGIRAGIHDLITDPDQETLLNKLTVAITTLLGALNDTETLDSVALDEALATASDDIGKVLASTSTGTEKQPPAETTTADTAPVTR